MQKMPDEKPEENPLTKYVTSDYVVPPKVPQLHLGPGIGPQRPRQDTDTSAEDYILELPPDLQNPQKAPCVNVPEWFVKEGGELCLSDTTNGRSTIRYWPKFLSERGNNLMFNKLRKYCKWHQKQVRIIIMYIKVGKIPDHFSNLDIPDRRLGSG